MAMASPLRSLVEDESRYRKCFQTFLDCSSEHQCLQDLIHKILPSILTSIGEGKAHLKVIGVGSGAGEMDLQMLSQLHLKYPAMTVDNQVVEPNNQQIQKYRDTVSQKLDLDYIKFSWNKMKACEFQEHWKANHMSEQADFIHMIQMLYYVKDPGATISFFRGLLSNRGKLLIIHVSGESGCMRKLWKTYGPQLNISEMSQSVTMVDIKGLLDSQAVSYQSCELPCHMDITECFTEGDEQGELLLDFLTEVLHFSQMASAEFKAGVLELLRHSDCSSETSGRIMFKYNIAALVVDPLH